MKVVILARFSPRPANSPGAGHQANQAAAERTLWDAPTKGAPSPDRNSCDVQLEEMREWCRAHDHTIVAEFREDMLSGDEDRPVLNEAVDACRRGYMLLCRDFQRVSRNARFLMYLAADLAGRGVSLYSLTEGKYEHDDDELWLSFSVRALFGEYVRRKTKKRTKNRMLEHQAGGRRMSRVLPYGWRIDPASKAVQRRDGTAGGPSRMIDDEGEREIIARIVAAYDAGSSLGKICKTLEADRVLCRGSKWYPATLRTILRREGCTLRPVGRPKG